MPQILSAVFWYLLLSAVGWLVFPISYRFFSKLPDRGVAFLRPLGLLLFGFIFWILSSYGLLHNHRGGLLTAILLVGIMSFMFFRRFPRGELGKWLRSHRSTIIFMECLFLAAFLFITFVRASRPDINHTEQPMELAFINGVMRSTIMPPLDPWLSNFSISYYYFGYLMVGMLAKLVGVVGSVAFNLGFISIFSMAALASYGVAHNLLALYRPELKKASLWLALLAPLFILILGNAEGLLEILHARHVFWETDASGNSTSKVWAWLDVKDLVHPPNAEPSWTPRLYGTGGWWWWRASRVINDRNFLGGEQELIDEFPAFSFVLGDLHPHVLSMPFVMLAIAWALNIFLGAGETKEPLPRLGLLIRWDFLLGSLLILGGLGFLNIWDFPIYVFLFAGAYGLRRSLSRGWTWERVSDFLAVVAVTAIGGYLLYLPFFAGFTSQAAGILPNLLNPSRGTHLWIMFFSFFTLLFVYAAYSWVKERRLGSLVKNLALGLAIVAGLWAFSLFLTRIYIGLFSSNSLGQAILVGLGAPDSASLFRESLNRRLSASGGWITLCLLLGMLVGLVFARTKKASRASAELAQEVQRFVWLLALVGTLLVVVPEFIYLRDQFGTRMNTVFKFYFQTWQMWGVASAFIASVLLTELRRLPRILFVALFAILLAIGSIYPAFAFFDITRRSPEQALTLDGARYLSADQKAAIEWLSNAPVGTLVEAVGGSYDASYARYAAHSGQPSLMGWPGHEGQWRGGNVDYERIGDVERLYSTGDWQVASELLTRYQVRYIVIGDVERNTYPVNELKFQQNLDLVFQIGSVTIYQVP
ncbi:MAG: DUF2298 domain-containing protein [Anaerolineales bacterium]